MSGEYFDRSSIWLVAANTPAQEVARLGQHDAIDLARLIVNHRLNEFIGNLTPSAFDEKRNEAPIPYQGWYWRAVDFFDARGITVAIGDGQVGVCQNNKWGYPERYLTDSERAEFLGLVWDAYRESSKGGILSEINAARDAALRRAGEFIAALDMRDAS